MRWQPERSECIAYQICKDRTVTFIRSWFRLPWWRALLLAGIVFIACTAHAVATASITAPFGPHMATYEVTTTGQLTIDLGPFGTIVRDLEIPVPLGIDVTVHEIPDDFTQVEVDGTIDNLSADLNQYLRFFASPSDTFTTVASGLVKDIGATVLRDIFLLGVFVLVLAGATGRTRGGYVTRWLLHYSPWITAVSVIMLAVMVTATALDTQRNRHVAGAEVFTGTPLEGTRVTGRLGGLLETYGVQLMDVYRDNERFYEVANANLASAWDARIAFETTWSGRIPEPDTDLITMVVIADLHCNFSVSPLVTTLAERAGAQLVLHAGDATINGTAVEQTCVDSVVHATPDGATMVFVGGNHDSALTSDQFENAGAVVLRGSTVEVAGVRILGDLDPYETRIGSGSVLASEESGDEFSARMSETACEDDPDLVLIHTPYVIERALQDSCAAYTISGHTHRRIGPAVFGGGVQYVNASTAGAVSGQPTVGPLRGTAEMTVLRFDPETRRIVDYRLVSVKPSTAVLVSPAYEYPIAQVRQAEQYETDVTDVPPLGPVTPTTPDASQDADSQDTLPEDTNAADPAAPPDDIAPAPDQE
ncbi:Calcineurin-like phosphoesterase superfamily domain-containing protein [Micrococcales bacterium KH10]|nr:Calcineurin-like phosphoesterase superfamily domain-containing protein [Micrococcales bacterium KH10]